MRDETKPVVDAIKHGVRTIENALREQTEKVVNAITGSNSKPKSFHGIVVIHPLEPIKKEPKQMDPINLGQIPLGQRLPVQIVPDEPVDVKSDGNFASATVTSGDSTVVVAGQGDPIPERRSTAKSSFIYFNGDGAVGAKGADVAVDGHVGPDDVEIVQSYTFEVISPDATEFKSVTGKLEPIPTA